MPPPYVLNKADATSSSIWAVKEHGSWRYFRRHGSVSTLTREPRWFYRYAPILVATGYLLTTLMLFAFGPWPFPVRNPLRLYGFLVTVHLALIIGYFVGIRSRPGVYVGRASVRQIAIVGAIISLGLLAPTSAHRTGSFIAPVDAGLADPGEAYARSRAVRSQSTALIEYVRMAAAPALAVVLPIAVFYWRGLRTRTRLLMAVSILGTLGLFIAMGTNKAIADTVVVGASLLFAAHAARTLHLSWPRLIAAVLVVAFAFVLFLVFFGATQTTREGSAAHHLYFRPIASGPTFDGLMGAIPKPYLTTALGLSLYVTQGYYALSLALEHPFIPMYGAGNSIFLTRQIDRWVPGFEQRSYPRRIERVDGWDAYNFWSSIYPWIASDVSFAGTPFVVFMIGLGFAMSWRDTLTAANPIAVVALSQFIQIVLYFPANNQALQSGEGFVAFWVIICTWMLTRRTRVRLIAG